ncbi:MAG: DUF167 family protein [Steroidobacteraceae bacterium]
MERSWCRRDAGGLRIAVRIQPRAGADRICGVQGGRLKIRIAAAPVDDAANERLRRFVARLFDVPQAAVSLVQGGRSRDKLLAIAGVARLPPALSGLAEPGS